MDYDGSYRRFGAHDSFPSNRPPNNNLSRMVEDVAVLSRHERNVSPREANRFADDRYKSTDYGRDTNSEVEAMGGYLSGVATPQGGSRFGDFMKQTFRVARKLAPLAPLLL